MCVSLSIIPPYAYKCRYSNIEGEGEMDRGGDCGEQLVIKMVSVLYVYSNDILWGAIIIMDTDRIFVNINVEDLIPIVL